MNDYVIDFRILKEYQRQGIILKTINNYLKIKLKAWVNY